MKFPVAEILKNKRFLLTSKFGFPLRPVSLFSKTFILEVGLSVTRLEDFLKFLVAIFQTKETQMYNGFMGYFEKY